MDMIEPKHSMIIYLVKHPTLFFTVEWILVLDNVMWYSVMLIKLSVIPQILVLTKVPQVEKANAFLEDVLILVNLIHAITRIERVQCNKLTNK